jgi:hypothetical protein
VGELVLEVGGAKPAGYRYPFPESAILVFGIRLEGLGPQTAPRVGSECSEARFVDAEVLEYLVGQKQWLALVSVVMDE